MRITMLLPLFFLCKLSLSQQTQIIQSNQQLTISSKVLNEERTILVRLPDNYTQTQDKYPVVYMLDGQAPRINLMTGTIQNLAGADLIPEMIVVSIPNTDRRRDMTPTNVSNQPGSGGADNFLTFIETELMPEIEKKYRVQPYRILAGHSLSGLFTVYSFLSRPQVFNAYLAASPHLQWDDHFIIKRGAALILPHRESARTVFVTLGNEPDYMRGFQALQGLLSSSTNKKLEYEFSLQQSDNHTSTNIATFDKGLRKIWSDLSLPETTINAGIPLADIEKHYKKASEKYGYTIPIPENLLNTIGYRFLQQDKNKEALEIFEKNTKLYPASANPYDSYAEALEKDGQLQKAKENLETAVRLAEKGDNPELARLIKENYKRVSARISQGN